MKNLEEAYTDEKMHTHVNTCTVMMIQDRQVWWKIILQYGDDKIDRDMRNFQQWKFRYYHDLTKEHLKVIKDL